MAKSKTPALELYTYLSWSMSPRYQKIIKECNCGCRTEVSIEYGIEATGIDFHAADYLASKKATEIHVEYYAQTQRSNEVPVLR